MKIRLGLFCGALALSVPSQAAAQGALAESVKPHSSVSVMVEPALSDGRLIVRLAAKNLSAAPVAFGPAQISIAKPNGQAIALYPLQSLINDVRAAAGMADEVATAPTQGAYAAPQLNVREGGQMDVTGYTGGASIGRDQYLRNRARKAKPTISEAEAQAQIAALNQAILKDSSVAPGQIAVGQIVSDKLNFGKAEERTLHVRVRIAGDEHGFTIAAPTR